MKRLQRIFVGVCLLSWLCGLFGSCQSPAAMRARRQSNLPRQIIEIPKISSQKAIVCIIDCLKEEGYTIATSSEELGFVNATRTARPFSDEEEIASSLIEVTVHVKELEGGGCTVKAHFVGKDFDATGIVTALRPIQDSEIYEGFLGRIEHDLNPPQEDASVVVVRPREGKQSNLDTGEGNELKKS